MDERIEELYKAVLGDEGEPSGKRNAKLNRQLVQHRLDGPIRQLAEIGVDRFAGEQRYWLAVRSDRAVWARIKIKGFLRRCIRILSISMNNPEFIPPL